MNFFFHHIAALPSQSWIFSWWILLLGGPKTKKKHSCFFNVKKFRYSFLFLKKKKNDSFLLECTESWLFLSAFRNCVYFSLQKTKVTENQKFSHDFSEILSHWVNCGKPFQCPCRFFIPAREPISVLFSSEIGTCRHATPPRLAKNPTKGLSFCLNTLQIATKKYLCRIVFLEFRRVTCPLERMY